MGYSPEFLQPLVRRHAHTRAAHPVPASNVYELPFQDKYSNGGHYRAVLMHVPDTQAVPIEVKRALEPGGIMAGRKMIAGSTVIGPPGGHVPEAWATFIRLLAANGGHSEMGKEVKRALLQAGFADISATESFDYFDTAEEMSSRHAFTTDWLFMPAAVAAATQYGLATQAEFDQWRLEIDRCRTRSEP